MLYDAQDMDADRPGEIIAERSQCLAEIDAEIRTKAPLDFGKEVETQRMIVIVKTVESKNLVIAEDRKDPQSFADGIAYLKQNYDLSQYGLK